MRNPCPHDPPHLPVGDDGTTEVSKGVYRNTHHPTAGYAWLMNQQRCEWEWFTCMGWVWSGDEDGSVRPCDECRKGAYAVWKAGLWWNRDRKSWRWERNNKARAVFHQAEGRWPNWRNERGELMRDRPMKGDEEALADLERYPRYQ